MPADASSAWISAYVRPRTSPLPSVVRSRVSSWMTTSWSSAVRWTSSSMRSAPASAARRNALIVFSGAAAEKPRCATTLTFPVTLRRNGEGGADLLTGHRRRDRGARPRTGYGVQHDRGGDERGTREHPPGDRFAERDRTDDAR